MPKYSFKNNLFFQYGGGQHTIPADSGLPKPPCHTAHCVGCDTVHYGRNRPSECHPKIFHYIFLFWHNFKDQLSPLWL